MEKVLWIRSYGKTLGSKEDDGLSAVNEYLEKGWTVKHISTCSVGDNMSYGQAYIVIEKSDN